MPLRPAISRAFAISGAGKRSAIWTLLAGLSSVTGGDPFCRLGGSAAERCLRNWRPFALAHHFASSSSFVNLGAFTAGSLGLFIALLYSYSSLKIGALLSGVRVVSRNHADFVVIAFREDDRNKTVAVRFPVVTERPRRLS